MLRSLVVSLVCGGIGGGDIGVCTVDGVGGTKVADEFAGEGGTAFGEEGPKIGASGI